MIRYEQVRTDQLSSDDIDYVLVNGERVRYTQRRWM